jgi:hypothetical protein
MRPGQDSAEQIRRHEVSRTLKKANLSPEEVEVIELLSRSLVGKLLDGPITEVMARAEAEIPFGDRPGLEAPRGLERHGGANKPPGSKTNHQLWENGQSYIERDFDFGDDQVSGKPALAGGETGGTGDRSVRS